MIEIAPLIEIVPFHALCLPTTDYIVITKSRKQKVKVCYILRISSVIH